MMDRLLRRTILSILCVALLSILSCGKESPALLSDRLWVNKLPRGPRDSIAALVLSRAGKRNVGAFYRGSLYRGSHELLNWKQSGENTWTFVLKQDNSTHQVRTQPCNPSAGFDYCIRLIGDPSGIVKYQSRKRWAIRRDPKDSDLPSLPTLQKIIHQDKDFIE